MSKREFTSVIVKLLGIYAIIQSLPLLQPLGTLLGVISRVSDDFPHQAWLYVGMSVPFLLVVIVAILLLVCSGKIARFIIKDDGDLSLLSPLSSRQFQAICFSAVGVFVFLGALPQLSRLFMHLWQVFQLKKQYANGQFTQRPLISTCLAGIPVAIQCGLAIILFFRSTGLANLWHRIQIARYVKVEQAEPGDSEDRV